MVCPVCGSEMVKGKLLGDRIRPKWLPDSEKLIAGGWLPRTTNTGAIVLKEKRGGFGRPYTKAFVCKICRKMTIDI